MRYYLTVMLIIFFAVAHSVIGVFGDSTFQPKETLQTTQSNMVQTAKLDVVSIVKNCCKKNEATSHSSSIHCSFDCNLFYTKLVIEIGQGQPILWRSVVSGTPKGHISQLLRPPIS